MVGFVKIEIAPLPQTTWRNISYFSDCSGKAWVVHLLQQKKLTFKPIFRKPVTVTVTVTVKIETDRHVHHFVRSASITWGLP